MLKPNDPDRDRILSTWRVALFWSKVDVRGPLECWRYRGTPNRFAMVRVRIGGRELNAPRAAYDARLAPSARGKCLSRVAWLGGTIPAVRGLKDLEVLLAREGIEPVMLGADTSADLIRLTFDPTAAQRATVTMSDIQAVQTQGREGTPTMTQRSTGLLTLSEADSLADDVVACCERRGIDPTNYQARERITEEVARSPKWRDRIAAAYPSPFRRDPNEVARFGEQTDALNRALVTIAREKGLDATDPTDRAICLAECANDPRYRGSVVPDYGASSVGHDGRAGR